MSHRVVTVSFLTFTRWLLFRATRLNCGRNNGDCKIQPPPPHTHTPKKVPMSLCEFFCLFVDIKFCTECKADSVFFFRNALEHIPPLSLSPACADKPAFLTKMVLQEVEKFITDVAV